MKDKLYVGLLLLSGILIHHLWFFNYSVLSFADWGFFLPITQRELFAFPSIWNNAEFGGIDISLSMYPINFLWGVLSYITNFAVSERLLYFFPSLLLSLTGSYLLIKKNTQSAIGAFIGALVFSYNTYFMVGRTGHLTLMTAFALGTFLLYFFQRTLEQKKIIDAFVTGIFAFLVSIYEFRAFYIMVWVLFFYFIYFQFVIEKKVTKKTFFHNALLAFIPLGVVGILSTYWIVGFLNLGTIATNEIFNRILFGSEFANLSYAFALSHPFWTGAKPTEFITQPIPLYFWIIPLFAFAGLVLNRKSKHIVFFSLIALIGIFLTKQIGQPFSYIYPFLYEHFPGFNAFRESSKFYFLIALGYSVLIAAFVNWIWANWNVGKWKIYGKYCLTIIIAVILLWNTKPVITGEIGTLFTPRHVPQESILANDFIIKQDDFFRTLWVPTHSRWSVYSNEHPRVSAIQQMNGIWSKHITQEKSTDKFTESELLMKLLQKPYANNLLDAYSIKYVFVPLEDRSNDDNFFRYYGKDKEYFVQELSKLPYLKRTNIGTKNITVYENTDYNPHIYTTQEEIALTKKQEIQKVQYKSVSATEHRIELSNVKKPILLHYASSYHPQWNLRIGDFNWFEALTQKNYFIPSELHMQNEFSTNSYRIDPQNICQQYSCLKTNDGGYDIEMTLYFRPQYYVHAGGVLSAFGLICLLCYFTYNFIRRLKYGKKK